MSLIIREIKVKKALSKSGLPEYDYALNPYLGCQHGCVYCYARDFTSGEPATRWGEVVYVKVNLIEVLSNEVKGVRRGIVGLSTITDPYQPIESKYKLSRGALGILCDSGFHVSVQTKSALVLRDIDLLRQCGGMVDVGLTITTMRDVFKLIEPNTQAPLVRAMTIRKLARAGVKTWIFLGPIIPGINDSRLDYEPIIRLAKETNSQLIIDRFRPRKTAVGLIKSKLGVNPIPTTDWWRRTISELSQLCSSYGVNCITEEDEWRSRRRDGSILDYLHD
ncbi:MAG: SPL family radical SAM protein [Caldivirga sp.]|jgi:DNA repair photolyase|uniref:SPL family radical SAM protein n=2 Tax=Caldivirga sp. TaxID=2080243 RepID=UPI003D0ACB94